MQDSLAVNHYWIVKEISEQSGVSAAISHSRACIGGGQEAFLSSSAITLIASCSAPICIASSSLLCQHEGGGGQMKQRLHKIGQSVTFTPKMSENRTEWLSLNKYLSSPSTHTSHTITKRAVLPVLMVWQNSRVSLPQMYIIVTMPTTHKGPADCTQDYVKDKWQKNLKHTYSWVKFGEN